MPIEHKNECLFISGDLNFQTVPILFEESLSFLQTYPAITIDFSSVVSSNSAGVALLIEYKKQAEKYKKTIHFHHIPLQLQSLIDATEIQGIIA